MRTPRVRRGSADAREALHQRVRCVGGVRRRSAGVAHVGPAGRYSWDSTHLAAVSQGGAGLARRSGAATRRRAAWRFPGRDGGWTSGRRTDRGGRLLVKSAVQEATPRELEIQDARELMEDVVRWSVEAYYQAA